MTILCSGARLMLLDISSDTARLPALPAPSITTGEEAGSLLVIWSPLVLAVGYSVELRPAGTDGPWAAVEAKWSLQWTMNYKTKTR